MARQGLYSRPENLHRGAARVPGINVDAKARFAAEVNGVDEIGYRQLSACDVGALGEASDIVLFLGVLYHLRHPLLALDLIHEHVPRTGRVTSTRPALPLLLKRTPYARDRGR